MEYLKTMGDKYTYQISDVNKSAGFYSYDMQRNHHIFSFPSHITHGITYR